MSKLTGLCESLDFFWYLLSDVFANGHVNVKKSWEQLD